ncbi:hypothetical protein SUDANB1_05615 [Streptomyces sp. enrichment culture]|uniref:hypothetical protein n=1 Tax=Streptomyces sp. enrichment culture TaxID=1795815 RepID=UPI003F55F873
MTGNAAKDSAIALAAMGGYRWGIAGEHLDDYRREFADKVVGFGPDDVTAIREAIEAGRLSWTIEEGATWEEIAADARKACILTFHRSSFGVLVTDEN